MDRWHGLAELLKKGFVDSCLGAWVVGGAVLAVSGSSYAYYLEHRVVEFIPSAPPTPYVNPYQDYVDASKITRQMISNPRLQYRTAVDPSAIPYATRQVRDITFEAEDGVHVFGRLYESKLDASAPIILLFHQGASNAAEYSPIAPKLNGMGFHALAIDSRSGTTRFNRHNQTSRMHQGTTNILGAYLDLEASLDYIKREGFNGPVILWGSSYSASLVFKLAHNHPHRIDAIMSFSPSAQIGLGLLVGEHVSDLERAIPVFMTWAQFENNDLRHTFFQNLPQSDKSLFVQKRGDHGSLTLWADRNPDGLATSWGQVEEFLDRFRS
ncbi:MAG: alpha/beta hydrolase [Planctomycetota bacterium]|nr:alpha/beta hydrolase [Planctomycetota bacterium]